jgi:hypothetical protein
MVLLSVLSGTMAGTALAARRFPYRLGRGPRMNGRFDDPGVWDFHLELTLDPRQGFILRRPTPEARAQINGQDFDSRRLHNGDLVEFGAVKLRFALGETTLRRQRGLAALVWLLFGAVLAAELTVIYQLTHLFLD